MSVEMKYEIIDSTATQEDALIEESQEVVHYLHDDTDRQIIDALEGAHGEVARTENSIQTHSETLRSEVARLAATLKYRADLDASLALVERDRLIEAAKQSYRQQVDSINEDKNSSLGELRETLEYGEAFFAVCARLNKTTEEGIALHQAEHDNQSNTIERMTEALDEAQADRMAVYAAKVEKIKTREELLRIYDATERITKNNRKRLVDLELDSADRAEEEYRKLQKIQQEGIPLTDTAINEVMGQMANDEFAYRTVHRDNMNFALSITNEIDTANTENIARDKEIKRLRNEIDALNAQFEGLGDYILELGEDLAKLQTTKQELAGTTAMLRERARVLRVIAESGIDAIDTIPLELQEIVTVAINTRKADHSYANSRFDGNFVAAIPELDRSVVSISVPAKAIAFAAMSKVAGRITPSDQETSDHAEEIGRMSFRDKMDDLATGMNSLRQWVQENARGLLPEAEHVIPEGIMTPGLQLRITSDSKK